MKHPATRELYGYWQRLRGSRPAPDRREIEPADIRAILGDTFILEVATRDDHRFRLAGTRVCALFGRELKGVNFIPLWQAQDRGTISALVAAIAEDAAAAVIGLQARTSHERTIAGEALLLPLRQTGTDYTRIIATLAPSAPPYWLGTHHATELAVTSLRLIWPDERPRFLDRGPDAVDPASADLRRQVKHLVVYEGGRA